MLFHCLYDLFAKLSCLHLIAFARRLEFSLHIENLIIGF